MTKFFIILIFLIVLCTQNNNPTMYIISGGLPLDTTGNGYEKHWQDSINFITHRDSIIEDSVE